MKLGLREDLTKLRQCELGLIISCSMREGSHGLGLGHVRGQRRGRYTEEAPVSLTLFLFWPPSAACCSLPAFPEVSSTISPFSAWISLLSRLITRISSASGIKEHSWKWAGLLLKLPRVCSVPCLSAWSLILQIRVQEVGERYGGLAFGFQCNCGGIVDRF